MFCDIKYLIRGNIFLKNIRVIELKKHRDRNSYIPLAFYCNILTEDLNSYQTKRK